MRSNRVTQEEINTNSTHRIYIKDFIKQLYKRYNCNSKELAKALNMTEECFCSKVNANCFTLPELEKIGEYLESDLYLLFIPEGYNNPQYYTISNCRSLEEEKQINQREEYIAQQIQRNFDI